MHVAVSTVYSSLGAQSQVVIFEPKLLKTHVDHIQVEFKTKIPDGAMFMTQMPLSQSTIMGYMRDGKVHVATNIYNVQRAPAMMVRKKVNGKERGKN